MKPGAASRPFFGVEPAIVDTEGRRLQGEAEGHLVLTASWPGQARGVHGDEEMFRRTYFSAHPGTYFTGDGARREADGTYWITGRVDDVLNVSGHRLGTAEIESALVSHPAIAEAAVVGRPPPVKGQGVYAFVTPRQGFEAGEHLRRELVARVRAEIGPFASPDAIQWVAALPKTRSGKILRATLRAIANGEAVAMPATIDDPAALAIAETALRTR